MKKIYLLLITIFITNIANAQWQKANGPFGGPINCIVTKGDTVYAGTKNGVYISFNNGTSWNAVNNGFQSSSISISSLAVIGNNLFVGTSIGVFISTNNGNNWSSMNNGLTNYTVQSFAIKDTIIFAGTNSGGMFKSTNNGLNWTAINSGLTNLNIKSIVINSNNLFVGTSNGVFLSTNNGISWISKNTGLSNTNIFSLAISGGKIFAGTNGGGVFLSTDNGNSWGSFNSGLASSAVFSIAIKDSNIYAGTGNNGVYKSSVNSNSWSSINSSITNLEVLSIAFSGINTYIGTYNGVFLSNNNGNSWVPINTGINITNYWIKSLSINGNNIYAGTLQYGVFTSTNQGNNWTSINTGIQNGYAVSAFSFNGNNVLAGTNGKGVYLSTNYGNNWIPIDTGLSGNVYVSSFLQSGNNLFLGTNNGVYLSTNNGNSWNSTGFTIGVSSLIKNGNNIYAGVNYNNSGSGSTGVYMSSNNGLNWTLTGLSNTAINSLASNGNSLFACTNSNIYLSTNNGNSWSSLNSGLTGAYIQTMAINSNNIFIGTSNNGIYISNNNGNNWINVNTGLTNYSISAIAFNDSNIFIGTNDGGIWKRKLSDFLVPANAGTINGINTVCQRQDAVIYTVPNIANASSYIWTLPSGAHGISDSNSIIVHYDSLAISGNITVKGSNSCFSGISSSLPITVKPFPVNASYISGISNVYNCQNSIIYTVPSITNSTSYVWTIPNGANGLSDSNSIVVNYTNIATSGNIKVQGHNSCGNGDSSILAITVNPFIVDAGNNVNLVCGLNTNLSPINNYQGLQSNLIYQWSPTYGLDTITKKTPKARPFTTTKYYLNLSTPEGCQAIDSVKVTVNPLSLNANNITITCGDSSSFGATINSNSSTINYIWAPSLGLSNTNIINPKVKPITTTIYHLTAKDSVCVAIDTLIATVNKANFYLAYTANQTLFTAPPFVVQYNNNTPNANNFNFIWSFGDDTILNSNNNSVFHTYGYNGLYSVSLLATNITNSCQDSIQKTGYIYCTGGPNLGITEQTNALSLIKVYPNPVTNELNIELNGNKEKISFEIFNSIGQSVFKGNIIEKSTIQTLSFAPGIYIIKLNNGKVFEFKKIVKE